MAGKHAEVWIEHWLAAMRWRRRVESELAAMKLTLAQWLVLDTTARVLLETRDAVFQKQVAQPLNMDKATMSQVMERLDRLGLIDREPGYPGPEYRIYLSQSGKTRVEEARVVVELASASMSNDDRS